MLPIRWIWSFSGRVSNVVLPALTVIFGLQFLGVLTAGLEAADRSSAFQPLGPALLVIPVIVALLASVINRIRGTSSTLAFTAGGLALARVAEQLVFSPAMDLGISLVGITLFFLFLTVYSSRLLGRGARGGGLFALGVLLGFAGDSAIRGSLDLLALSWHQEAWALAVVVLLAAAQLAVLSRVLRQEPQPQIVALSRWSVAVLALPVGLVLVLELLIFQNPGLQGLLSRWAHPAVFGWLVLANAVGIAVGTVALALRWKGAFPVPAVLISALLAAAVALHWFFGSAGAFILVGQAASGLVLVYSGIALGSGVRLGRVSWITAGAGLSLLLVAALLLYLQVNKNLNLPPFTSELAPVLAGAVLLYALVATVRMVQYPTGGRPAWGAALIALALLILPGVHWLAAEEPPARLSPTGIPVPALANFDSIVTGLMERWQIPGGTLAMVKDGRLVLARGYGLADVERREPVQPDSLFRIASISKPITAVAILGLVEDGLLDLDTPAFNLLDYLQPSPNTSGDPRTQDIKVHHLLQHSGGWDRRRDFDPMFIPGRAAREVGVTGPPGCETVIRFMLGQRLAFDPGTRYAYSNFGYCILGRVLERTTGRHYEEYVRNKVLSPMGITKMRIGSSLFQERAEGEVRYYARPGAPLTWSVFPDEDEWVPRPYGGFYLEAMDSHGGWIGSAIDLMRFVTAVDGSRETDFGEPEAVALAVSRPAPPLWVGTSTYYGMGWNVRPTGRDAIWWHSGSLEGTITILVRTREGLAWAALFNSRPRGSGEFLGTLITELSEAANQVDEWPAHDLFERYESDEE